MLLNGLCIVLLKVNVMNRIFMLLADYKES